jgi:hypothetical protein
LLVARVLVIRVNRRHIQVTKAISRLLTGIEGRLSFRIHHSRFHGLLNHDPKHGAPSLGEAVRRSSDPGAPPRREARTPFRTTIRPADRLNLTFRVQSLLSRVAGHFRDALLSCMATEQGPTSDVRSLRRHYSWAVARRRDIDRNPRLRRLSA